MIIPKEVVFRKFEVEVRYKDDAELPITIKGVQNETSISLNEVNFLILALKEINKMFTPPPRDCDKI